MKLIAFETGIYNEQALQALLSVARTSPTKVSIFNSKSVLSLPSKDGLSPKSFDLSEYMIAGSVSAELLATAIRKEGSNFVVLRCESIELHLTLEFIRHRLKRVGFHDDLHEHTMAFQCNSFDLEYIAEALYLSDPLPEIDQVAAYAKRMSTLIYYRGLTFRYGGGGKGTRTLGKIGGKVLVILDRLKKFKS